MTPIPSARLRGAFPLLTALLLGCGSDADPRHLNGAEWLSSPAEPVRLELTLDSANARTRTITPRGGLITATGSDGTIYRLQIPRNALLNDAEITVFPVANVRGLPLRGGGVAAVHLEPDGLRLLHPATLTITSPVEVPVEEQVAYGYFGDGEDAHLYPLDLDLSRIEMKLLHFSGYGFGRAPRDDPGRKALQRAASYEARMQAQLAEVIARERSRQILGVGQVSPEDPVTDHFNDLSIEYYDAVIRPLMKIAETDERMASCCLVRYFSWARQLALLGGFDDDDAPQPPPGSRAAELNRRIEEAERSAVLIMRNAFEKARSREIRLCREEHDFAALGRLISTARAMVLLGQIPEEAVGEIVEEVQGCLNFEVEFRSIFDNGGPDGVRFYYHVSARVPVEAYLMGVPESGVLASAPLEYERFDARARPQAAVVGGTREGFWGAISDHSLSAAGTRPGSFRVHFVGWEMNLIDSPATDCDGEDSTAKKGLAENFYVLFSPGLPTEITRFVPVGGGLNAGTFNREGHAWARHWANAHGSEAVSRPGRRGEDDDEDDGAYRIALAPVRVGGVWRADFKTRDPGVNGWFLHEDGYLVLRHTPR